MTFHSSQNYFHKSLVLQTQESPLYILTLLSTEARALTLETVTDL